jgi:hypothetical protein
LKRRWRCNASTCPRRHLDTFCFVDSDTPPQHHPIQQVHFDQWAFMVESGEATTEKPSDRTFKALVQSEKATRAEIKQAKKAVQPDVNELISQRMNMTVGLSAVETTHRIAAEERQLAAMLSFQTPAVSQVQAGPATGPDVVSNWI